MPLMNSDFSLQLITDVHIIDSKPALITEEAMDIHINVKNFGPIEKAEIDLRPLTVFVGESNTGKTYLAIHIYTVYRQTGNAYYLPAARSGIIQIATALQATREGLDHLKVSTFSGMIGDFLEQIVNYKERRRSSSSIHRVAEQLETELLEGRIEVKHPAPEAYPEFLYRPDQAKEGLRMSHSSAMVSELAPLVLFLRGIVKRGDLLIIEEPESHLHPGAQTKIAQTLARLVRAGVRVLITTHSNFLLQQIGNLIREGELQKLGESTNESADYLKAEEVGAWQFYKNESVTELPFDLVEGIEPEDHLDIAEDLYNRAAGLHNRIEQAKEGGTVESE